MTKHLSGANLAIGLGLVLAGLIIAFDASRMQIAPAYARIGPHIFPYLVAIGLALTGATLAWQAFRPSTAPETEATDWMAVAVIAAGLVAHLNLLKPVGFVPAAIVLFMCVAFAFGSRSYVRDFIVAVGLAFAAYVGFSYGLGLQLPPGILKGIL